MKLQRGQKFAFKQRLSDRLDRMPVLGDDAFGLAQQNLQMIFLDQCQRLREIVCAVLTRS